MDSLEGLPVFVRTVREGSFSAAARALDLTPSAVSKQIGRLEDRLSVRLFNRTTRRLSLTEEGAAFYERASRILTDLEDAAAAVSSLRATPQGRLRVTMPSGFGLLHFLPVLPDFLARYPELDLDIDVNDRFVDMVDEGFDVALRIGELQDSSLISRRLSANHRVLAAAPGYLHAHGAPRRIGEVADHNCLVYTYRAQRHDWHLVDETGAEFVVTVSGNVETNNPTILRASALAGVGLVLLPLWLIGPDLKAGRLVQVLPRYHGPDSAINVVYPPGRHLSARVRCFVDFLVERFAD
ncbi:LysR family transcriptional regulator [Pelagibius litoralis]|uniref:LysR family transcriptional regulator n=1 Tax=Pelagibius litoralis TaxID=374515 RepID=A0A967KCS1_9PROT|nr:LysR family transcriptional regulator [Pelagibius litoralis]NIA71024.1 LysR family transcriptional regulator [Pelagibius litoralis]